MSKQVLLNVEYHVCALIRFLKSGEKMNQLYTTKSLTARINSVY